MVLKSSVIVNEKDFDVVKKFANCVFWEEENKDLFAGEFQLDLPYAPPGMYQHITTNEVKWHFDWLRNTVFDWHWSDVKALGTNKKNVFWVFRIGEGNVRWGGKDGHFKSKFATLLEIQEGKIKYVKDFFDTIEFYKAMGIELPAFAYDAKDTSEFKDRPALIDFEQTEENVKQQVSKTLEFFRSPDYWNPEVNNVLSEKFVHELTFAPANMPRIFKGKEYDALNEWLERHLIDGTIYDEIFYETTDPHIYVTEYNCIFETNWGYEADKVNEGAHGRYPNREVSYIELDDNGRCIRLDEYLNPTSKFLSINQMIPTFPYMYY